MWNRERVPEKRVEDERTRNYKGDDSRPKRVQCPSSQGPLVGTGRHWKFSPGRGTERVEDGLGSDLTA